MRKLFFIPLLIAVSLAYGQRDTLAVIGSDPNNQGGDSRKVAYEKMNEDIKNGNSISKEDSTLGTIKYIDFNLGNGWLMQEGRAGWNDEDKTLNIGLDRGSVLQVGQETHLRCTNKSGVLIPNGSVVYVSGAQGNRPTIELAVNTNASAILTLGIVTQDIDDGASGYVTLVGLVRYVDTRAYSPGDVLWIGDTPGSLVNIRPDAPNHAVTIGVALNSTEFGLIAVRPTVVQRLSWLTDVTARDNEQDNDLLVWDAATSTWNSTGDLSVTSLEYADTYWDDLNVPLTNTRITPALAEPVFEATGDGTYAWAFDDGNDSTWVNHFIAQTSHMRKDATDLQAHFHWQQSGTGTGDVVWKLVYVIANVNGTFTSGTLRAVATASGDPTQHQIIGLGTIPGAAVGLSAIIKGNVGRMGDAPDDTFTGTVYGLEIDFHYEKDTPGSDDPFVK